MRVGRRLRRWVGGTALATAAAVAAGLCVAAPAAQASTVSGASFSGGSGTVEVGGSVYTRSGGALTLSVVTSSDTKCIDVTGALPEVIQTSGAARSTWTVAYTAPVGDGQRVVSVAAYSNFSTNSNTTKCNGNASGPAASASFVLDNTGPTVTPVLTPAPNAAGWNNNDTVVTWVATDPDAEVGLPGSGVASQPTQSTTYSDSGVYALTAPALTDRLGNVGAGSGTLRLDGAAPTIVGSRTPTANQFGWNDGPVTVHFDCTDNPATDASGLAAPGCPADRTVSTDGSGRSVTGSVADVAGNSASATVGGINIDTTAPTLTGVPTTSPNDSTWYAGSVTVRWTAGDALSGVDPATVPGDSTISSEGRNLTASASVADRAGNVTSATSAPVNIDMTPPVTGISGTSNDWTNGDVTVTLSPVDALSGVASTQYAVDGGAAHTGTSFTLSTEGDHVVTFRSADNAGNVEATRTAHVKIDKTAPSVTHAFKPSGYSDGAWTDAAKVTVTFTCTDALSGVASCSPPVDVTSEGGGQQVTGIGTDNAGNSASDTGTVSIDRTPPAVSGEADRAPNGNGWYSDDVTVSYTCADQASLSGIKSCPASQRLGEGQGQTASGTAVDNAGNTATASVTGINVDKTPPSLDGAATMPANENGWYNHSIVVTWRCADALSGIAGACPADSAVSGEGSNRGASASVSDKAGNTTTSTVDGIHIDVTAPVTTASLNAPMATGWYARSAYVTLNPADNLSGVAATYYTVDGGPATSYVGAFDFSTPGAHTITFWSVDHAGNVEDATAPGHAVTVQIDNIPPRITGAASPSPNSKGWNNTPVTVHFDCSDAETGIASCTPDTVLSTDGGNQSVTGVAADGGGNTSSTTVSDVNVDITAPSLSGAPATSPNANGWYRGDVTVRWTATDATSGIDGSTLPTDTVVTGEGAELTAGPVTVSDLAGNTASASVEHLKIDRTPPVINGAATTGPNDNGWYHGDVTVGWTCSDALSGIGPNDCPADSTVGGEGDNLSATASVADQAGNTSASTLSGIKIDRTAPTTTISAPSGWRNTDATVTLSAADNLSGVANTYYTINDGPVQTGTTITFSDEGAYDLQVWSVDNAGNVETAKSVQVLIDKTAPTITHTQSPAANDSGWNNSDVTITFTCIDSLSGIATCTSPIIESREGRAQPEPGTAVDNAGNEATDPATVSIDKTPPTIGGTPDRAANDKHWYNADVTVTFTCADQEGLSGVAHCSTPVSLGEGADQSVTGAAIDAADNTASTTVGPFNVDETPPSLSGAATNEPNGADWYNGDVTVHWTCHDALSGIDGSCPADTTVTGEGNALSATATVSDKAGNDATASVGELRIDRTAPVTAATLPPPDSGSGWYAHGPTVSLVATDNLSGVAATYYQVDDETPRAYTGPFTQGLEGMHTVTFWSTDRAGNIEDANTVTIRVDTTTPTITGSRLPAANDSGWNNTPVTVSFVCGDAGSGVQTCPDPVTLAGEGAAQSVTGLAADNVGNSAKATVGGINIDLTKPTLTGAPTTDPNDDGWYSGDVTVHWTCSDALSGLAGDCPEDSTIIGEGTNLSATASVSDKAGNTTESTVNQIKIDRRGPQTTVSAPSDWQTTGVDLSLTATDNLSGVNATYYTVDDGATQEGNTIALSADGIYTLAFWSTDYAGNEGTHGTATVKIDQTAPTISHTLSPEPNDNGWNNSDITVNFICADATSGIASCSSPEDVTAEGGDLHVTGTAVDNAGNSASDTATVNLDKTPPTISGAPSRKPNANGWYNANVTVHWSCNDALSGVATCPADQTLGEDADQSVSGTASDAAGNAATATVGGINVDKTPPILTGAATTKPDPNGWYRGDVTVHWTCSDALSGIDGGCPADSVLTGSGDNLSATATVTDQAGNPTTSTVSGIKIDRTPPVTTASVPNPTFPSGWYGAPVTVTLSATDDLSGVAVADYSIDGGAATPYDAPFEVGTGVHSVTFWSTDNAGNAEDRTAAGNTMTFKVDNIPPAITGAATTSPNANGWYNGPVNVHFTCADAESGIATCPADTALTSQGANQSVTGTAADVAGNTNTATVGPIDIDLTAPTFADYTGSTSLTVGQPAPVPTCHASDDLSGLADCQLTGKSGSGFGNANGVGDFSYTFTATDKAGNAATQVITLHIGYQWNGFLQPITNTAHDLGTASVFKAGSTVPVKFKLTNATGTVMQATYMPLWITPADIGTTTASGTAVTAIAAPTVGGSFKWDPTGRQYIFNWQAPKNAAGHYYRIGTQLDSGDTYTTLIVLK